MSSHETHHDADGQLATKSKPAKPKRPPLYTVIMLNDDYTPMEFVVWILTKVFRLSKDQATHIMLTVHHKGRGTCGTFPKDVALTKVAQVHATAKSHQHPLRCIIEAQA